MPLDAQGYFNALRASLNTDYYEVKPRERKLELKEKIFLPDRTQKEYKVNLGFSGDVIAIKLDKLLNGSPHPLFHFLNNNSKPWAKRCDFVIFNLTRNKINVHCIEFKSGSITMDTENQLRSSLAWCKAFHSTIKHYLGESRKLTLTKFVFSECSNVAAITDAQGYLNRDHTIKHYLYSDLKEFSLSNLVNTNAEEIK